MKTRGIVRKVDELGRIVIPKETRKLLYIDQGDSLEIFEDDTEIILRKYAPGCTFCGNIKNVHLFKGVRICNECTDELKELD